MKIARIYGVMLVLITVACVDPFSIKNISSSNRLVVEGVFSNLLKKHQIFLSRETSTLADNKLIAEKGATVTISDQFGNVVSLNEAAPGTYETPEISAQPGNVYILHIKTGNGDEYSSAEVPFQDGIDLDSVYARYVFNPNENVKGIQVYVDTHDPDNKHGFYRWNYIATYEVHAPFPSNWVWLGGNNFDFRYDGIDTCYVSDTLKNILIQSTTDLERNKLTGQKLQFIREYSHILRYRYCIFVQQFCISKESYSYWENVRNMSEQTGTLSEVQPGSLAGNIVSVTNPDEMVLGYFDACHVSEKRVFFSAIDFYREGLKDPSTLRSNCYYIAPILISQNDLADKMPVYESTMLIWEFYGSNPAIFELMPKSCCDCRDQGPTDRPPFF
jgi:hypothetical protein